MIFVHIPKAGGTTFTKLLGENLPLERTGWDMSSCSPVRFFRLPQGTLVTGHIHVSHRAAMEAGGPLFTILRDPVDRLVSYYHMVKDAPGNRLWTMTQALDLYEFADYPDPDLDNGMTRFLSSAGVYPPEATLGVECGQLEDKHLQEAKETLRAAAVVGFQDQYASFLEKSGALLGLEFPKDPGYVNRSNRPKLKDVPQKTIKRIKEVNALDMELYQWARSLYA